MYHVRTKCITEPPQTNKKKVLNDMCMFDLIKIRSFVPLP